MSINEFVEMTIFLCLICFSIYDKMHDAAKSGRKTIFAKSRH